MDGKLESLIDCAYFFCGKRSVELSSNVGGRLYMVHTLLGGVGRRAASERRRHMQIAVLSGTFYNCFVILAPIVDLGTCHSFTGRDCFFCI